LPEPDDIFVRWLDLCDRYGVLGLAAHDARIAALLVSSGMTDILTYNRSDFDRYAEIACRDPSEV
jgi:hypothetical protein